MNKLTLVYIACESMEQAKYIGNELLEKKLCACVHIIPRVDIMLFWPPQTNTLSEGSEVILLAKTLSSLYNDLEKETIKLHTYEVPCMYGIEIAHVYKEYYNWVVEELTNK